MIDSHRDENSFDNMLKRRIVRSGDGSLYMQRGVIQERAEDMKLFSEAIEWAVGSGGEGCRCQCARGQGTQACPDDD